jgi:hypothetical protein
MIFKYFRITAVLLSLFFVSVLLEITLRVTMSKRYPKGYFHVDTKSGLLSAVPHYEGFRRTENGLVRIKNNRYGFRGDFLNRSNPDVQRILILGDSFVQAAQVNYGQTFGNVLQLKLGDTQVMQVGIPGWGQGDQLRWLKTYYDEFQPHLVIVAVFLGNDLPIDNMKKDHLGSNGRVVTREGDLLGGRKDDPVRVSRRLSLTTSYAYTFIRHRLKALKRRLIPQEPTQGGHMPDWVWSSHRKNLRIYERDPGKHQPYYATFFELIEDFKAFCTEKNILLIILSIPWDRAIDGDRFATVIDYLGLDPNDYDALLPHTVISEYIQRIDLPYLDLRDHFIKKNDHLNAYGKKDNHFSQTGHAWTAEALHALILELKDRGGEHWNFN